MFWLIFLFWPTVTVEMDGVLYPRDSEIRESVSLNGLWNFRISPSTKLGYDEKWYSKDLTEWINGQFVMAHEIGHLPFQKEITSYLNFGAANRITVACDNILGEDTIPQGSQTEIESDLGKVLIQTYSFDFFNYAGIDRPVTLFTTPDIYIDDITIHTDIEGDTGIVNYVISVNGTDSINCDAKIEGGSESDFQIFVELLDKSGSVVAINNDTYSKSGTLVVTLAKFWWPYLMDPDPGYLYTMKITLKIDNQPIDIYRQPVGIRTLKWDSSTFTINGKPIYMYGFGKHEDSDIRGKGLDLPLIIKDYNLIKWIGANTFRTSHYPYADEIMDLADQMGIMVIDECPSVDTDHFVQSLLKKHKSSLTQLIKRDKNRPSVIAWSVANEARTQLSAADDYFRQIASHVKALDKTRPTTIAIARGPWEDKAGKHFDIISFNRYNAWYSHPGRLDLITQNIIAEAKNWRKKYNKPVIMSEYGADAFEGLHIHPEYIWSEEYQLKLMSKHFKAFDELRNESSWFIGEFVWNFADFKTPECKSYKGRFYSSSLLEKHKSSLTQLIRRDKNRPSVIAWSIANEPRTGFVASGEYFGHVANHVRSLDMSRPITMSIATSPLEDNAGEHLDIISFNRYNAWYHDSGRLDIITQKVLSEARTWREKYNKPVLMSEYGADTYEGLHIQPEYIWSEEYQITLMSKHFKAFDELRKESWFIGEFIWNFADFKTAQTYTRVGGNKKGLFTRNRQPKSGAFHIRRRYWLLSQLLYEATLPKDLHPYEVAFVNTTK